MTGSVKWFHDLKGFGFIAGNDGHDYYVHYSEIQGSGRRTLDPGAAVEFEIGPCGLKKSAASALNVHAIE